MKPRLGSPLACASSIDEKTAPCKYFCLASASLPSVENGDKIKPQIRIRFNYMPQRVLPTNIRFALYMYRQFMPSLCTKAQVCAGTRPEVYTARTAGIWIQVYAGTSTGNCTAFRTGAERVGKFGTTSVPVPETSVSSVRQQHRYRKLR